MDLITPDFGIIFWQTITLGVVFFILGKFAWRPILQALKQREDAIETSLRNALEAKQLLAQIKVEQDQLVESSTKERDKIINEAIINKTTILETVQEESNHLRDQVLKEAREIIIAEKELAFNKLHNEMALISIQLAEKLLNKELTTNNQQEELVRSLMKDIKLNQFKDIPGNI